MITACSKQEAERQGARIDKARDLEGKKLDVTCRSARQDAVHCTYNQTDVIILGPNVTT